MHDKVLMKNGVIVEVKIWDIPKNSRYPDNYKYSLYAIQSLSLNSKFIKKTILFI